MRDELKMLFVCVLDISEPGMALNGLISVPSESNNKLPSEVSNELASIQEAGTITKYYFILQLHSWGIGIRGLMRGMATLPQGNQELLVVRDKVGSPPG